MVHARFTRYLLSLVALLALLAMPTGVAAAPAACADIQLAVDYLDPSTGQLVTLSGDASARVGVPVGIPLTVKLFPGAPFAGKPVVFNSPNQFLRLDTTSISDGGVASFLAHSLPDVNFIIRWATGDTSGDSQVTFAATIDPASIGVGKQVGSLLTVGARVTGGRCGAHIELFGVPGGGGPGPGPCPGIAVLVEFEDAMGAYKPVMPVTQSPINTQYAGPDVGYHVRYTITSSNGQLFTPALQLIGSFNRQTIESATGAANTITNLSAPKKVFFDTISPSWNGQQVVITTRAITVGLDTVRFDSLNKNGTINRLCSTHRELQIAATPGD